MVTASLWNNVKVSIMASSTDLVAGSTVSDTTDLTVANVLDMAGFEGVTFIALPMTVTAAGTIGIIPKFGSSSGTLTLAATSFWAGTSTLGATTDMSQKYFAMDIVKPLQRYVGVRLHRATQNSNLAGIIAIQYGNHKMPTTSNAAVYVGSTGLYSCANSTAFGTGTFVGTTA